MCGWEPLLALDVWLQPAVTKGMCALRPISVAWANVLPIAARPAQPRACRMASAVQAQTSADRRCAAAAPAISGLVRNSMAASQREKPVAKTTCAVRKNAPMVIVREAWIIARTKANSARALVAAS